MTAFDSLRCPQCGSALSARVEARLQDCLGDMNVELSTVYTNFSRRKWQWLRRDGRYLLVDLHSAARFWETIGRANVAARLRARAQAIVDESAGQARWQDQ